MIKKTIEGYKMYLDPTDGGISKALVRHGFREPGFMWILRREADGIAVDVGANIGYCTLSLADRCEKVYAYEPDPRSLKLLRLNTKKLLNVIVCESAISERGGTVHISLNKKPNLSSMCIDGDGVDVSSVSLKEHLPEATFVKMDIEGAEIDVLIGCLDDIIDMPKMKLLIEVHPKLYGERKKIFQDILKTLTLSGYYFKYVVNAKYKMEEFRSSGYKPRKSFKHYKNRAVFENVKAEHAIPWCTEMPDDGFKIARSFLLCKE